MGENPSRALAKAAVDPSSLTDEELLVISACSEWWNEGDIKAQLLLDAELSGLSLEQIEPFHEERAIELHGGNPVAAAAWRLGGSGVMAMVTNRPTGRRQSTGIFDRSLNTTKMPSISGSSGKPRSLVALCEAMLRGP